MKPAVPAPLLLTLVGSRARAGRAPRPADPARFQELIEQIFPDGLPQRFAQQGPQGEAEPEALDGPPAASLPPLGMPVPVANLAANSAGEGWPEGDGLEPPVIASDPHGLAPDRPPAVPTDALAPASLPGPGASGAPSPPNPAVPPTMETMVAGVALPSTAQVTTGGHAPVPPTPTSTSTPTPTLPGAVTGLPAAESHALGVTDVQQLERVLLAPEVAMTPRRDAPPVDAAPEPVESFSVVSSVRPHGTYGRGRAAFRRTVESAPPLVLGAPSPDGLHRFDPMTAPELAAPVVAPAPVDAPELPVGTPEGPVRVEIDADVAVEVQLADDQVVVKVEATERVAAAFEGLEAELQQEFARDGRSLDYHQERRDEPASRGFEASSPSRERAAHPERQVRETVLAIARGKVVNQVA